MNKYSLILVTVSTLSLVGCGNSSRGNCVIKGTSIEINSEYTFGSWLIGGRRVVAMKATVGPYLKTDGKHFAGYIMAEDIVPFGQEEYRGWIYVVDNSNIEIHLLSRLPGEEYSIYRPSGKMVWDDSIGK